MSLPCNIPFVAFDPDAEISEQWSRVLDEARQQFSGPKRPRRFPLTEDA